MGSIPGQQLGDVIYSSVMAECVNRAVTDIVATGVDLRVLTKVGSPLSHLVEGGANATSTALDISFFDDGAFIILGSAEHVLAQAPVVSSTVIDAFTLHGMRVRDRTLRARGFGGIHMGALEFETTTRGPLQLNVTRQYPHLGTILDEKASLGPEIARRRRVSAAAWHPLRRRVYYAMGKSKEDHKLKLHFLDSL
eukprot:3835513-Pyramimonas_sp.AAC.1